MKVDIEPVFDGICHLGECPVWHMAHQKLYWTDILERRLWVYDPRTRESRRFWEGSHRVGGFAFTRNRGMVMCTDTGVYLLDAGEFGKVDGRTRKIVDVPMDPDDIFNDITVDPKGRIFGGVMRQDNTDGTLYRIEKGKAPEPVIRGVCCPNGMTFSMDEKWFYHTDSVTCTITRYAYDADTGAISDPAVFYQGSEAEGQPDGITLDLGDHVWAAFWGASVIRRLDPSGRAVLEIPVPAKQPSSVMFGGKHLTDLYITTAAESAADLEKGLDSNGIFLGGPVYRYPTAFKGRPEWLADFG